MLSISEAAKRLGLSRDRVRGWVDALGIKLTPGVKVSLMISEPDFRRLQKAIEANRPVRVVRQHRAAS